MKVSKSWLAELVELNVDIKEVERLLPLRTIATKEITDQFIELDMKGYNRADLLSMRGVAYEVAAITDSKVTFQEPSDEELGQRIKVKGVTELEVQVENLYLVPLYCLVKIAGLKISESPKDWVQRLGDCGMRSVNNIADVTNLVMLEYGQPLHAFDASKVVGEKIVVRTAKTGETIETLDGKIRELEKTDLIIADSKKSLGIAGVMGGKNSEVTDSTTDILLEVAIFDPGNLRKTARRLNLTSEASKRFYHGLTRRRALQALDAAIRLYQDLGGKLMAVNVVGDVVDKDQTVIVSLEKINSLIGVELDEKFIEESLVKLNFKADRIWERIGAKLDHPPGGFEWRVMPPYWRLDIEIEEDVIEEIARLYGYEKIPSRKLAGELPVRIDQSLFELIYQMKSSLVNLGLTEVQTYSFFSTKVLKNLDWMDSLAKLIKVANPISSETEYMRVDIWPNLVEVIDKNSRQGFKDLAIFEIGKIYKLNKGQGICEMFSLSIAVIDGSDNPLQEVNEIFQQLSKKLNLGLKVDSKKAIAAEVGLSHPNRFLDITDDRGQLLGGMFEVHKRISDKFGIPGRVAILEISLVV